MRSWRNRLGTHGRLGPAALAVTGATLAVVLLGLSSFSAALTSGTNRPIDATAIAPNGTGKVLAKCKVGSFPGQPAYDPVNHYLYVPNEASGNISVVAAPCTIVATISTGSTSEPSTAAFDPQDNEMYVVDSYLNQVYVISGTTVVATLNSGWFNTPTDVIFDPGDAVMLVANFGASNLTEIYGTTVIGSITVGSMPSAIGYDPFYNAILVENYGSDNVSIIPNACYPTSGPQTTTTNGGGAWGIAFDPEDDYDYIASPLLDAVVALNGLGGLVGVIKVGFSPLWIAFDQATLSVFVANHGGNAVWEISGTSIIKRYTLTGSTPLGVAYSDYATHVYATSTSNGMLYELD